jgi:hypothetical protein
VLSEAFDLGFHLFGDAVFDQVNVGGGHVERFGYLAWGQALVEEKIENLELLWVDFSARFDHGCLE